MATEQWTTTPDFAPAPVFIPPLEQGDRLSRAEFERRYHAMPHVKKAELIEGVVYLPSPVRQKRHSGPHTDAIGWLHNYKAATPGVDTGDNATVRLDLDNEPQPDAVLFIEPEYGGQIRISEDDYIENAPELVVEVASSSASYDLDPKLKVYRRNGVLEYIVWRVLDKELDWFILREGVYQRHVATPDGLLKSEAFPGLWLDAQALLARRHADVALALKAGLASPKHAQFVEKLRAVRGG